MPIIFVSNAWAAVYTRYLSKHHTYWADPDYTYLMNGLTIAQGVAPWHVEHPGTSLQAANGAMAWLLWRSNALGTMNLSLTESVTSKPEAHLLVISILMGILIAISMLVLGVRMLPDFGLPLSVLAQGAPLISLPILTEGLGFLYGPVFVGNRPEPVTFALVNFSLAVIAPAIGSEKSQSPPISMPITLGALLGIMISLKISALPLAIFLPLVFLAARPIISAYLATLFSALLMLTPIWTRGWAVFDVWKTWNSYAENPFDTIKRFYEWLPSLLIERFILVGAMCMLIIGALFLLIINKTNTWKNRKTAIVFLTLTLVSVFIQLTFVDRWYAWWIVPVVPIVSFGAALAILGLERLYKSKLTYAISNTLVISFVLFLSISAVFVTISNQHIEQVKNSPELLSAIALEDGSVVYDYSVTWSYTQIGTDCTSLINGDAFAREIAYEEVTERCPDKALAGFTHEALLPMTPLWDRAAGERLRHSLYCQDLQKLAKAPAGLSIVTPGRDFDYIKAETVVEEGGWRLSRVIDIDCAGSPVRNELPNPATLAARQRISNLPVIGPIYRNWPFRDEIQR